jgi:hypothetical protein
MYILAGNPKTETCYIAGVTQSGRIRGEQVFQKGIGAGRAERHKDGEGREKEDGRSFHLKPPVKSAAAAHTATAEEDTR